METGPVQSERRYTVVTPEAEEHVMVLLPETTDRTAAVRVRPRVRTFADPVGRITTGSSLALVAMWVASIGVLEAIAPTPAADAVLSTFDLTLSLVYTFAIMGAAIGLLSRLRFGAMSSIAGGAVLVTGSLWCWAGGHIGSWITVQFVAGLALAGLSAVFLQRT